jgi:hypothetical protein
VIALALALAASSIRTNPTINVYNFHSADSCATWTNDRKTDDALPLEGWILGFVSGANAYGETGGDIAPGVTSEGLIGWVDQYCLAHPLDSVTQAGFKLVRELKSRPHPQ